MSRQFSTAVSDGVLAFTCYLLVIYVFYSNIYAGLGFGMQAIAATFGIFRFMSSRPSNYIVRIHDYMSWLSAAAGMPLVAVGFCKYILPYMMNMNFMASMGLILTSNLMDHNLQKLSKQAMSGFAVLTIMLSCFYSWNFSGLLAAFVYVAAGLVVGAEGTILIGQFHFQRIDILHYLLAVGNLLFLRALAPIL